MSGPRIGRARVEPQRRTARPGGGERLSTATPPPAAAPLLVVLPALAGRGGDGLGRMNVAGIPIERRIALAAARAGFGGIVSAAAGGPVTAPAPRRIVALAGHVLPQPAWLRGLLAMPLEPETLYVDGAVAVIHTQHPARVLDAAARCGGAEDLVGALDGAVAVERRSLDASGRFSLEGPGDVPAAEAWLLSSLIKPSEGFMSRHVERRISLAVTRRLAATGVTPNAMTAVSVAIGLAGALFFLSSVPALQILGALLFVAHSVLDGCDGELARLKFQESRSGAILDFWGDNVVHVAVFACMAVGWSLDAGRAWPLLLGGVTIASALATATLAASRFISGGVTAVSPAGRLAEALSHRDFIYLVLLLSAFGQARWFLAVAAVGTPAFLLFLLLLGGGRRHARRP